MNNEIEVLQMFISKIAECCNMYVGCLFYKVALRMEQKKIINKTNFLLFIQKLC